MSAPTQTVEGTDAAGSTATTYAIASNEIFFGSVGTPVGDTSDWIAVSVPAGATYLFYVTEESDPSGTLSPALDLYNSSGAFVQGETDNSATDAYSLYTNVTGSTQTIYMAVSQDSVGAMNYAATALNAIIETVDATNTASTVATISEGEVFIGSIGPSDLTDWIKVYVGAGEAIDFHTQELNDTLGVHSPFTGLYNDIGYQIAYESAYDDVSSSLTYTNNGENGEYVFLQVSDIGNGTPLDYVVTFNKTSAPPPPGELTAWTNEQIATQLTQGYWDFSGAAGPVAWDKDPTSSTAADYTINVDISRLTVQGQAFATVALEAWSFMTGLAFNFTSLATLSTDPANSNYLVAGNGAKGMIFDDQELGSAYAFWDASGSHFTPLGVATSIVSAGINIGSDWLNGDWNTTTGEIYLDSYSFQTYMHEIGHALGLGHGGNYNGSATYANDALYLNDSWQATVMSYFSQTDNTYINADYAFISSPMIADIMAIQDLYGVDGNLRTGNTTYGHNSTAGGYLDDLAALTMTTAFTILDDGGIDTIDLSGETAAQRIDLTPGAISDVMGKVGNMIIYSDGAGVDTIIENVIGGSGADKIIGNAANNSLNGGAGADSISGGDGNDILNGRQGNDSLIGGDGDDILIGWTGNDYMDGGAGVDTVDYSEHGTGMFINLNTSLAQTVGGSGGIDTILNVENLIGSGGGDTLYGNNGVNSIDGGNGNDRLFGFGGVDILVGGAFQDTLRGGAGDDILIGGSGRDIMSGAAGADTFVYLDVNDSKVGNLRDRIQAFVQGEDIIDLSAIDAITGGADDAFTYIGNGRFNDVGFGAGALRAFYIAGTDKMIIEGDINGDNLKDFQIEVQGFYNFTQDDFIL